MLSYNKQWCVIICDLIPYSELKNAGIQGMYPTAIVVLVEMEKSIYDTEEVTRERGFATASHGMVFAPRELEATQGGTRASPRSSDHFRRSSVLGSAGIASKQTASTKVELELVNRSRESIPGK